MLFSSWMRSWKHALSRTPLANPACRCAKRSRRRRLELEVLEARCVPTAGLLDPSFGGGGEVLTNAANFYSEQVAVLPDGGVIKAGSTSDITHFEVARFKADGSPFTAFGSGG